MIRLLYSLMMWLAQPFLRRKLAQRGVAEPGYLEAVDERFGYYQGGVRPGAVWVHAVSLGETRAAAILIERLRQKQPGVRVLLTHGTATGRAEGKRLLQPGDLQVWYPWDTQGAVRSFLEHFRPCMGILMETEVWPNMAAGCKARRIPLTLANGRLSDHSLQQARRLSWLSRPAYGSLAAVWAQTEADARRFALMGALVQGVFGNLKFDATPDGAALRQGRAWRVPAGKPVVMFASSREGEEEALLRILAAGNGYGAVQWLIVPRHPQRFDEVAQLVTQHGLTLSRRREWGALGSAGAEGPQPADIWLGDSLGEMALYYGMAEVALLGGSFEPLGGQNLIEAAACGCPVVMGPHTFNFAEAAELAAQAGAARRVDSLERAVEAALVLVGDGAARNAAVKSATNFAARHRGAGSRTARAALELVGVRTAASSL